jgi:hypothetical protein
VNLNLFSDTIKSLTVEENPIENSHKTQINSAKSTAFNEKNDSKNKLGLSIDNTFNHIKLLNVIYFI